jgi:hypothetical protein
MDREGKRAVERKEEEKKGIRDAIYNVLLVS